MSPKYPLVFRHFCRPNDLHVFATDPEWITGIKETSKLMPI
jgi:hypothetical protein